MAAGLLVLPTTGLWAQGIVVNKSDGSKVMFKASEVESITTYSEDNEPAPPRIMTITVGDVSFNMIYVEGGTFTMGATSEQLEYAYENERPAHSLTLSSFYIGETEVTQELWDAVMATNNSWGGSNPKQPVQNEKWTECTQFVKQLSSKTKLKFSLPTEAQWEFAARGGNNSKNYMFAGSNDVNDVGWNAFNSEKYPHDVKQLLPNELGLYDMTGNVNEWCSDYYDSEYYSETGALDNPQGPSTGSYRVYRGGSYYNNERDCRVSTRGFQEESFSYGNLGLRLVMTVEE